MKIVRPNLFQEILVENGGKFPPLSDEEGNTYRRGGRKIYELHTKHVWGLGYIGGEFSRLYEIEVPRLYEIENRKAEQSKAMEGFDIKGALTRQSAAVLLEAPISKFGHSVYDIYWKMTGAVYAHELGHGVDKPEFRTNSSESNQVAHAEFRADIFSAALYSEYWMISFLLHNAILKEHSLIEKGWEARVAKANAMDGAVAGGHPSINDRINNIIHGTASPEWKKMMQRQDKASMDGLMAAAPFI
ncbi:MAG: hypothetical protein COV36_01870 [Alphaproteobacteria bacterium CG11_big_fil_rev_8_21_14_0_20_44_7]|nr:MAG: hypothetical protein COV36_01870 [Alphaproteobacteria bacterium CG11_big_fil_rev_8_21_14_0_20_44_7]